MKMSKNQETEKENLLRAVRNQLQRAAESEQELQRIERIIEAMRFVDRRYFVDDPSEAYLNEALPIGQRQTISQPYTVARMLQLAGIDSGHQVLEVGSGSGWNACITAWLAYPGKTESIERIPELSLTAAAAAEKFIHAIKSEGDPYSNRMEHLEFKIENIFTLEECASQYDRIIITAGITPSQEKIMEEFALGFLKRGGRLVCPYVSGPLIIKEKMVDRIISRYSSDTFVFVPLIEKE